MSETAAGAPDTRERVWTSLAPIEHRWETSAAALIAVRRVLAEAPPGSPAADEFVRLYDWAAVQSPELFTRCWQAPVALHWVRRCYDALGHVLHGEAPADALDGQLAHFKAIALGVAVLAGESLAFDGPYRVALPFAIPGTGRVVAGTGTLEIRGTEKGELRLASGAAELRDAPVVEVGPVRVELNPFALAGLGADFPEVRPTLAAGLDFQIESAGLVRAALEAMRRFAPVSFAQFAHAIRYIALKPARDDDPTSNVSVNELSGAFVALRLGQPLDLADTLVHELHHNRLFCIEDETPLLEDEQEVGADPTRHYSPWREDPRPVRGILHAVYVTVPVAGYWLRVLESGEARGPLGDYARDRARRSQLQLAIGIEQLARLARFTPAGKALFGELVRSVGEVRDALAASGLAPDPPAFYCTVGGEVKPELEAPGGRPLRLRESMRRHIERYDLAREVSLPD